MAINQDAIDYFHFKTAQSRLNGAAVITKNPQINASIGKVRRKSSSEKGRHNILNSEYASFIDYDEKITELVPRKYWLRATLPDKAVLRLIAKAWCDPDGPLGGQGFVAFFRTDRDTLGAVFEDERGHRALWTIDVRTHTPRRLGPTA